MVYAEHLIYGSGGPSLILWLKNIQEYLSWRNSHLVLSLPFTKETEKTPCLPAELLSSIIAKTLEIIILNRMSPILDEIGFPDINQTAYQKGTFCADVIFSTPLNYIRQGETPFLCFYNIDLTLFSMVNHDVLSKPGTGHTKHNNNLPALFYIGRGVKQGSILLPSLFLVIMNSLLQKMRSLNSAWYFCSGCGPCRLCLRGRSPSWLNTLKSTP